MGNTKRNFAYKVFYGIIAIVMPIITAPYVTRVLGAENLGVYTYAFSVVMVFYKVAQLGILNHGSRSVAAFQQDKVKRSIVFEEIYCIQFISAFIVSIAYVVYVCAFVNENRLIAFIQIIYLCASFFDISWFFAGIENFKLTVIRDTLVKLLSVILLFSFVKNSDDLWKYAIIILGSTLIGHISLWVGLRKFVYFQRVEIKNIIHQIKPIVVLFIPTVAVLIYTMMDKIMLGMISGPTELAFYQYSANIVSIPLSFITSYGMVMLPRMSNMFATDRNGDSTKKIINRSLLFVTFMACAFSFGLAAISEDFIPVYYGTEFLPCVEILVFIAMKLPFMGWSDVLRTQVLIPNNMDKEFIISLFAGAVVNLTVNLCLISKFGAIGVAIGTIAAEATVAISQAYISRKSFSVKKSLFQCMGFILIGGIMLIALKTVKGYMTLGPIVLIVVEILLGAIIYLSLATIFFCIINNRSPKEIIRKIIRKRY